MQPTARAITAALRSCLTSGGSTPGVNGMDVKSTTSQVTRVSALGGQVTPLSSSEVWMALAGAFVIPIPARML
jgi:hypothetical protein